MLNIILPILVCFSVCLSTVFWSHTHLNTCASGLICPRTSHTHRMTLTSRYSIAIHLEFQEKLFIWNMAIWLALRSAQLSTHTVLCMHVYRLPNHRRMWNAILNDSFDSRTLPIVPSMTNHYVHIVHYCFALPHAVTISIPEKCNAWFIRRLPLMEKWRNIQSQCERMRSYSIYALVFYHRFWLGFALRFSHIWNT